MMICCRSWNRYFHTFSPGSFNITLNLVSSINEKRDIPIILESINMSDDYEGSFDNRRAMITTLQFTAKIYLFGAVADNPDALIKRVNVDYFTDTNRVVAKREQRYSATPRQLKITMMIIQLQSINL